MTKIIYIAGPYGFSKATLPFHNKIIEILEEKNHIVLDTWKENDTDELKNALLMKPSHEKIETLKKINYSIGKTNQNLIDSSNLIIAMLDGPDVDSGTAAEIGYAYAKGKKILGCRLDFRKSGENEGCKINVQVEYFIKASGGYIYDNLDELYKNI